VELVRFFFLFFSFLFFFFQSLFFFTVLARRLKGDRIEVWTRDSMASNETFVKGLKVGLQKLFDGSPCDFEYKDHHSTIKEAQGFGGKRR